MYRITNVSNVSQVKLQEAIEYEDLQRENGPNVVALNLKKSDRLALFCFWLAIFSQVDPS